METYPIYDLTELLRGNEYPGRGIVVGTSADGNCAVSAYFIMGRSTNSRNRVFALRDGALWTEPFDETKVTDPSLILYRAVCAYENRLIVTNGDQTDTILAALQVGGTMESALETRTFEPDAPNFTPRISAVLEFASGGFSYKMSILKSADAVGSACLRQTFSYPAQAGVGHFLHTYAQNGDPLPPFSGEPEKIQIEGDCKAFAKRVWDALDENNKISLFVRFTDLKTGAAQDCLYNKNGGEQA
ncbi:MAG: IMP cyclohydrolase [Oscillospiraceae bacterium]|nr:IMP cyclohydrolase [Oscillospiraceae bacterium]